MLRVMFSIAFASVVSVVSLAATVAVYAQSAAPPTTAPPAASFTVRSAFLESGASSTSGSTGGWYKGNVHTHSNVADGDTAPEDLARWYAAHDNFQFVVLTDHDALTPVDTINARLGQEGRFLVIAGEEVTDKAGEAPRKLPVHLNGLHLRERVQPQGGRTVAEALQRNVDAIRRAGGVPTINHPNYKWAIGADDVARLRDVRLIEVFSANPDVNTMGGGGLPSVEETWDRLLTRGMEIYGVASDDAHSFTRPWARHLKQPGGAWVVVRSPTLDPHAIVSALDRGEFYASTGVTLDRIAVTPRDVTITVGSAGWEKGRIQFIGRDGRLLKEAIESPARYAFVGDEGYVRARIMNSNGHMAWTQPIFLSTASASATR